MSLLTTTQKTKYMIRLFIFSFVSILLLASCGEDKPKTNVERHNKDVIPEIEKLDQLIVEEPENHQLLFERAKVYYNNEGYQEAIDDLKKAIAIDSSHIPYYHLLADSQLDNFKSRNAIKTLEDCFYQNPTSTHTQLKLSEFFLILKQYDQSIQMAGTLLEREPANAEAYFMMGMNYRAMKDTVRAKNSFKAAVENDAELVDAWMILGDMHFEENDPTALDYYNGALTANPNSVLAKHSKAYYLQNNGDVEGAQKLYSEIIQADRSYVQAPINSGILYLEHDNFEKARELFGIVIANYPQNPLGHYYRGLANRGLKQIDAAKEDFQNSINLDPTDQRVRKALEELNK